MRSPVPTLLLITDPDQPAGPVRPIIDALSAVSVSGVAVQLRAKTFDDGQLLQWAHALREATSRAGVLLLINGRPDIALACQADGVHLPETGLPIHEVRTLLGKNALIGVSRHDARGLQQAQGAGADYATLGPIGKVLHKTAPLGVQGFRTAIADVTLPVLALGGIAETDVRPLLEAGATGIALRSAVRAEQAPATNVSRWLHLLDTARA